LNVVLSTVGVVVFKLVVLEEVTVAVVVVADDIALPIVFGVLVVADDVAVAVVIEAVVVEVHTPHLMGHAVRICFPKVLSTHKLVS
jgi:hypothetical protein